MLKLSVAQKTDALNVVLSAVLTKFLQCSHFDLTYSLSCQVHDRSDFFKSDSSFIRDIESACLAEFPDFFAGKIEFDRLGLRVYIEKKMILARNKKAWSLKFETFRTVFRFLICRNVNQIPVKRTFFEFSFLLSDDLGIRFFFLF